MSLRPDGVYRCDRCGAGVGNGGYTEAVAISGADPADMTVPRRLHLCLACQDIVLAADVLADYTETMRSVTGG